MFTSVALEGQFQDANGDASCGTICVTPNSDMSNDGVMCFKAPICGTLDEYGRILGQDGLALTLVATDDPATTPIGSYYVFSLKLDGQGLIEFSSGLPSGNNEEFPVGVTDLAAVSVETSPVVTLGTLIVAQSMVGSVVASAKFAGSPTVLSIDVVTNQLTLSENAETSGTDDDFQILTGAVSFARLQANAL